MPTVADAQAFYADLPRYMRPIPWQATPTGLVDLRASTCGECHTEIYDEWRRSTHAHAFAGDPQFMAELEKSTQPDNDVGWLCVNCHTPLENQLPQLVAGLDDGALNRPIYVDNPRFDAELQQEAISCATCHVQDGVIVGPYGDSANAPHPVRRGAALQASETCTQCHQATAHFPELALACVFTTGEEWEASPYAQQGQACQDCHMPVVERPIVPWGEPRITRRHWFGGSLIPKTPDDIEEIKPLQEAYPHGVTIRPLQSPAMLSPGEEATVSVVVVNDQAGHRMPSGDPERFLRIALSVKDGQGNPLAQETHRIGSVYQWYPEVELQSDNRLAPMEERTVSVTFTAPQQGEVHIAMEASKWRLSEENLAYHDLEGLVIPSIVIAEEQKTIAVQ